MNRGKRVLAWLLAIVMVCTMLPGSVSAAEDGGIMAAFYVSPTGSDSNDGLRATTPFATLAKAQEAVRKQNAAMTGDIIVYLMDGAWELSQTLEFDERDSGTNGHFVRYEAAPGAKPIISGGRQLKAKWTVAEDVTWLSGGLKAYKTAFVREDKLRAIYVNDQRASLTRKTLTPKRSAGTYTVRAGQAEWAWVGGSNAAGNVFDSASLPANTRNPQNIELESGSTWVKAMVCAASLQNIGNGETQVNFQMPYGAIAQTLQWNCAYSPTRSNDVTNVFEWLSKEGEFYFDQAGSTLYYIPRAGEDMAAAEVIVPGLERLVDIRGTSPMHSYAENIVFDGIKFAYTDWNLVEVAGSHGNATHQAATILTKYANGDWHNDLYRAYDVPPAAITVNTAKNIRILNSEISNTGYLGLHLENDVWNCEVTGNYIARTGGAGIVVGHPQHIYENDTAAHRVGSSIGPDKEKFPAGTESVPKHINITNNYLLENCYFFPGNSPITSFYTYDMSILNNFVYKCSYSGMSIGWGWCEYDGTAESRLPGLPTTTSRKNTVSNNRIEEICSILQDAGGIYTLAQQGNDDWTDVTVMNNNFINAKRAPQQANGSRMVNGFHPDEGSAFITMDGNVVTNIIRNVYELNDWKRKHDVIVTNGFSNTDRSETTAPNCTVDQYVNADYIWPLMGYTTVLNSGMEDDYVYMVGKDVIADTEYELASNVRMEAGMTLPRRGLLNAADTVWLAPAGTKAFAEGKTMTKAAGNEKSIALPETVGTYKLYIQYANGTVSGASEKTVYVGQAKGVANVADGLVYSISGRNPLVLDLNTDTYSFQLNGQAVRSGAKITAAGEYTLTVTTIGSTEAPKTIRFTTYISEANRVLPKNLVVKPGQSITLSENLGDPSLKIWIASQSASAFSQSDSMTVTSGSSTTIAAPMAEGTYDLAVVNSNSEILSRSDATVKVSASGLESIDFTDPAAKDAFEIVNPAASAIRAGEGLYMVTTKDAFEPANDQLSGAAATTPKDLVLVPVGGDWTATLKFRFDTAGASNGYYQFFGFYAMEDYQNCVGIRGGDGAMQDFQRIGGTVTAESKNSGPGLAANGTYWYQIVKEGDTYTCLRSADGEEFTQMFAFQNTGIEAGKIAIDAYTGMTEGYTFYLDSLLFEGGDIHGACEHTYVAEVTPPTCTEAGYTTQRCSKCGSSFVTDKTAALGHSYVDGVCTRCGKKAPAADKAPVSGCIMNFAADAGLTLTEAGAVSAWENTANAAQSLTQTDAAKMPKRGLTEKGLPYLTFDGAQSLALNGVNFNDMSALTILLLSRNGAAYERTGYNEGNGDRNAPLYVSETSDWSGLYLTPYQDWIGVRFGTSVSNCYIKAQRAAATDQVTVAGAVKDGTVEKIFDDGAAIFTKTGQAEKTRNIGTKLSVGYSYSGGDTYFIGDIYEIFVYDRALTDEEMAEMTDYLYQKYGLRETVCQHEYQKTVTAPTCTDAGYTTYTCALCADSYKADEVSALGHSLTETTAAATCTAPGSITKACSRCDYKEVTAILALGHDLVETKVEATCTAPGSITKACSRCDYKEVTAILALGHDFKGGVCTRCGEKEACDGGETCPSKAFTDVPAPTDWAHKGIDYCVTNKLMNGVSDTMFNPNGTLIRAQLVTILYRIAGEPPVEYEAKFSDVAEGKYYTKAVLWAASKEVVNGYPDGTFKPDAKITREQIAAILYRYTGSPAVTGSLDFPDAATVSPYAVNAMLWATQNSLINGIKSGSVTNLAPQANATRAQIAAIIMRYLQTA